MRVEETPGRLVVRDNPWPFWAFYSVFPLMGITVLYLAWATIPDEPARLIARVIGVAHVCGGAFMLWKEPASIVELDRSMGRLRVRRWGLFGGSARDLPLAAIVQAHVEVGEHSEGGAIYRPILTLESGEQIAVSLFWYQREEPSAAVAERLRQVLQISTKSKHP